MQRMPLSFERLIDPVTPHEFIEQYWERRYLYLARDDPGYYGSLLTFADMDHCIHAARDCAREIFTLVPPPDRGQPSRQYRGTDVGPKQLYKAFHSGETIVVNSAQRLWPSLTGVTGMLSEALSAVASINIYMTPADSQGFGVHIDRHDVFVIQVDGAKDWHLYEPYFDYPTEGDDSRFYLGQVPIAAPAEGEKLVEKVRLERGDLLYLPRGVPHKAQATSDASLHLTVGIRPLYWADFLKAAVEAAAWEVPELRAALPPGFTNDAGIRSQMTERVASLLELAREKVVAGSERASEAMVTRRLAWQGYPPDGHFEQLNRLDRLSADVVLSRRLGLDCQFLDSQNGAGVGISFAENEIRGPKSIGRALEFVCDRRTFRVADLPGLDDQSKLVLARRLVREGLLRIDDQIGTAA